MKKGTKMTDIQKEKMSISMKGRIPWNKGIKRTELEKINISNGSKNGMQKPNSLIKFKNGILKRQNNNEWKNKISKTLTEYFKNPKVKKQHSIKMLNRDKLTYIKMINTKKQKYASGELVPWNKGFGLYVEKNNNPNWHGGISFEKYDIEFNKKLKKHIRNRDNRCMICNIDFYNLKLLNKTIHIHHIDYNKKNNLEQNLISLCINCHLITNYNRDKWNDFFHKVLKEQYNYKYEDNKIVIDITQ